MNIDHRHTEYRILQSKQTRTHPIMLIAAGGLTIFSILGSAAITGLIPVNVESNSTGGMLSQQSVILTLPAPHMSNSSFRQYLGIHEDSVGRPNSSALGKGSQEAVGEKSIKSEAHPALQGSKIQAPGDIEKAPDLTEALTA